MTLEKILTHNKNIKFDLIFFINLSFCFFPLAYILGNFLINLNLLVLSCLGIIHLKNKLFYFKPDLIFKIIILFFFLLLFSTLFASIKNFKQADLENIDFSNLVKSFTFFRYLILLIIVHLLSLYNAINFKYFFYTATFFVIILSLDVTYQYIYGYDILGLESNSPRRNPGFFGEDEPVAGGYIERFSFFSIFLIYYLTVKKKWNNFIVTTVVIYILGIGIIFSGDRMPVILFLFGLVLIFIFFNKLRSIVIFGLGSLLITFVVLISSSDQAKYNYLTFYVSSKNILVSISSNFIKNDIGNKIYTESKKNKKIESSQPINKHKSLFLTAIDTWKLNKFFGNGIKSFRTDCRKIIESRFEYKRDHNTRSCSNHPHNYYLEILTEMGLIGFIFLIIFFLILLKFSFKYFCNKKNLINENNLIFFAALISLILELFPLRSSGSFFSTQNATYITFLLSIITNYKRLYSS